MDIITFCINQRLHIASKHFNNQRPIIKMLKHTRSQGQMVTTVQRETWPEESLVEGTIMVTVHIARIMFDLGTTHSFCNTPKSTH